MVLFASASAAASAAGIADAAPSRPTDAPDATWCVSTSFCTDLADSKM